MIEQDVIVTTKYGDMPSFAVCPDGPGPYPAILFYMDAPGIREELRNMARRIAKHGYYVLLPDLYYRMGYIRFDIPRRTDDMSVAIRACMNSITNATIEDDTAGMIAFVDAQDQAAPGPIGCVGYCMSGPFVTVAAAKFPDRIASAAGLYGIRMATDKEDSPHLMVPTIKGEMYFGFAELDPQSPPDVVAALKAAMDQAGTTYVLDVHANTHHGFAFPERPVYDAAAAEDAWNKMLAMWERTLKGKSK